MEENETIVDSCDEKQGHHTEEEIEENQKTDTDDSNDEDQHDKDEENCEKDNKDSCDQLEVKKLPFERRVKVWEVHDEEVEIYDREEFAIFSRIRRKKRKAELTEKKRQIELYGEKFPPWWNAEIMALRDKYEKLKKEPKRKISPEKKAELKALKEYQFILRKAKRRYMYEQAHGVGATKESTTSNNEVLDIVDSDDKTEKDISKNQTLTDMTDKKS